MLRPIGGLREFIEHLEKSGDLRRIRMPVDPRFEVAAVLHQLDREENPAILFERVNGYRMPIVGNLLGAQRRLASALCITEEMLLKGHLPNQDRWIDPVGLSGDRVKAQDRTVITVDKAFDIRRHLPVLTHYTKDSGPFITCGISSARDPRDGGMRRGLHRLEVRGPAELGISLVNPPLVDIYQMHRETGTRMEIAVAVGVDPAVLIATVLKLPGDMDKFSAAGGLTGEAVALMPASTTDLEVPATAEIIIEGYIDPTEPETEGLLGEVSGYYLAFSSPTIHITSISMQRDALFQALMPQGLEVDHLLTFIHRLNVLPKMRMLFPAIADLHFTPGTFGSHVVIATTSTRKGEIRRALTLALSFQPIKKAIIVNPDVDIRDPLAVEWALATRFQPDDDLIVISSLSGQVLDPSVKPGYQTAKIGMDATRPRREGFEKIDFPEHACKHALNDYLPIERGAK